MSLDFLLFGAVSVIIVTTIIVSYPFNHFIGDKFERMRMLVKTISNHLKSLAVNISA